MENFYKIQPKSKEEYHKFFFSDIKLLINGHKYLPHKYQNKSFYGEIYFDRKKSWYFPDFGLDPDPDQDPFFQKADPRIRIHVIMKRIRNTGLFTSVMIILLKIFLAFCCVFY